MPVVFTTPEIGDTGLLDLIANPPSAGGDLTYLWHTNFSVIAAALATIPVVNSAATDPFITSDGNGDMGCNQLAVVTKFASDGGKIATDGSGDLSVAAQNVGGVPGFQYTDSYSNVVSFGGMDVFSDNLPAIWLKNGLPCFQAPAGGYVYLAASYNPLIALQVNKLQFDQLAVGYAVGILACYYDDPSRCWSIVDRASGNAVVMTYADGGLGTSPVGHYSDAGNGYNASCDLVEESPESFFTKNWVCGDPFGEGIADEVCFIWPSYSAAILLSSTYPNGYFSGKAQSAVVASIATTATTAMLLNPIAHSANSILCVTIAQGQFYKKVMLMVPSLVPGSYAGQYLNSSGSSFSFSQTPKAFGNTELLASLTTSGFSVNGGPGIIFVEGL